MVFLVNRLHFNNCQRFDWGIAYLSEQTLTNPYCSPQQHPIFSVKSLQAETIIAVVGICLLGLDQILSLRDSCRTSVLRYDC